MHYLDNASQHYTTNTMPTFKHKMKILPNIFYMLYMCNMIQWEK